MFNCRAKLYALSLVAPSEGWKERGVGTLHVNTKSENDKKKSRLVMRSDGLLRVILNVSLHKNFEIFQGMKSSLQSEKFVRISTLEDGEPVQYSLRTSNKETAQGLFDIITELVEVSS